MGTQFPSPKMGQSPQFSARVYYAQRTGRIKMPPGMEVGLDPRYIVLSGTQLPPPQKGAEPLPQFSAHVYRGQTAAWIKMPLGTEVDLGLRNIVSMWTQLPPELSLIHI